MQKQGSDQRAEEKFRGSISFKYAVVSISFAVLVRHVQTELALLENPAHDPTSDIAIYHLVHRIRNRSMQNSSYRLLLRVRISSLRQTIFESCRSYPGMHKPYC